MLVHSFTIKRKKRTLDAKAQPTAKELDALMADLVERVWGALKAAKASMKTMDEAGGHAFHGNQWVKVATLSKNEVAEKLKEKTAKGKLRELLESGHAWTDKELMEIAGIDKEATFKAFIYYMRTPKFAGKKGALDVVKDKHTGLWSVKMDGEALALDPKPKAAILPDKGGMPDWSALEAKPKEVSEVDQKIAALIKEKTLHPNPPPAPPKDFGAVLGQLSGAHPGSMPHAVADKLYAEAMGISGAELQASVLKLKVAAKLPHPDAQAEVAGLMKEAVLKYKKDKAITMAAWAQATSGKQAIPKKPDYFKADEHLGAELLAGKGLTDSLLAWKTNTALEKSGQFPPKVLGAQPKPVVTQGALIGEATPVKPIPYQSLIPSGFEAISADDVHSGRMVQGINKLRTDLASLGGDAQSNKSKIEKALRERLKDAPNFQALVKRLGLSKEGMGSIESKLIGAWASSSGDGNPISVSLQLAARDAFGIPDSHVEKKALTALEQHSHEDKVYAHGITQLNPNMASLKPEELPVCKEALKEFVQAQYHETQAMLKKLGHDHVYLARGMTFDAKHDAKEGAAKLRLQPASSFSASNDTARGFAGSTGTVFMAKVPREQILSTYHSGFGCTHEHEVVVLAHANMKAYGVPALKASSAESAAIYLKAHTKPKGK